MNWQPIKTAPRDGTRVILYLPFAKAHSVITGEFKDGRWRFVGNFSKSQPTHWMPIPGAPGKPYAGIKFCKDCWHCQENAELSGCMSPNNTTIDLVFGKLKVLSPFCSIQRETDHPDFCGRKANWFVPMEEAK